MCIHQSCVRVSSHLTLGRTVKLHVFPNVFKWWCRQNNTATSDLKLQSYLLPEAYCTIEKENVSEDIVIFICIKEFKDWGLATRCLSNTHFVFRLNIFCRLFSSKHPSEIVKIHVSRSVMEFLHLCSSVNTFQTLFEQFWTRVLEEKKYLDRKNTFTCVCVWELSSEEGEVRIFMKMMSDIYYHASLFHSIATQTVFSACSNISITTI